MASAHSTLKEISDKKKWVILINKQQRDQAKQAQQQQNETTRL